MLQLGHLLLQVDVLALAQQGVLCDDEVYETCFGAQIRRELNRGRAAKQEQPEVAVKVNLLVSNLNQGSARGFESLFAKHAVEHWRELVHVLDYQGNSESKTFL